MVGAISGRASARSSPARCCGKGRRPTLPQPGTGVLKLFSPPLIPHCAPRRPGAAGKETSLAGIHAALCSWLRGTYRPERGFLPVSRCCAPSGSVSWRSGRLVLVQLANEARGTSQMETPGITRSVHLVPDVPASRSSLQL